jgi:hypothetical protein
MVAYVSLVISGAGEEIYYMRVEEESVVFAASRKDVSSIRAGRTSRATKRQCCEPHYLVIKFQNLYTKRKKIELHKGIKQVVNEDQCLKSS